MAEGEGHCFFNFRLLGQVNRNTRVHTYDIITINVNFKYWLAGEEVMSNMHR